MPVSNPGGGGAVDSVFGREGEVVAATSDYDAVQVDNTPAGNIESTNAQDAIDELDGEKAAKSLDTNVQTGTSYTLLPADNNKTITFNNASPVTVTLPQTSTATLPEGFSSLLKNLGGGLVTVVKEGADVLDGVTEISTQDSMSVHKQIEGTPNTYFTLGGTPTNSFAKTFHVETVQVQDYLMFLSLDFAGTITDVITQSISGTCTLEMKINTTAVTATDNAVSTTKVTEAVTGNNDFIIGDDFRLTINPNSACLDMSVTVKGIRT